MNLRDKNYMSSRTHGAKQPLDRAGTWRWQTPTLTKRSRDYEDFTLPHLFRRNLPESSGIRWTPLDSNPGMCWCDKGQIGMFSPGGVHWSPLESGGICQIPAESADSHQTFPLVKSTGLHWTLSESVGIRPVERVHQTQSNGIHRTPADSTGLHRTQSNRVLGLILLCLLNLS
jgi:hypothetical protein